MIQRQQGERFKKLNIFLKVYAHEEKSVKVDYKAIRKSKFVMPCLVFNI